MEEDIERLRLNGRVVTHRRCVVREGTSGHYGELTVRDCEMINEACRRFWMKRGGEPSDNFRFGRDYEGERRLDGA